MGGLIVLARGVFIISNTIRLTTSAGGDRDHAAGGRVQPAHPPALHPEGMAQGGVAALFGAGKLLWSLLRRAARTALARNPRRLLARVHRPQHRPLPSPPASSSARPEFVRCASSR
ncbi:MAG: hypothetical protein MZU95_15960 [Desulfomicrobium escambiense]|nr:hypothetical protein [Desulfomicrobium escambiense]